MCRALTLTPIGANLSHWADTVGVAVAIRPVDSVGQLRSPVTSS